jgi:DNA mismatch repair ATPase MutS
MSAAFLCASLFVHMLMNSNRTWFRHPLRDIALINERLDTIEFFLTPKNIEVASSLQNCLKNIKHLGVCKLLI